MSFDEYKLSDEKHNEVLAEIRDFIFENKTSASHPQVYILGGQPGAGKSILTENILQNTDDDNIISINGDEFRLWHPKAQEIFKTHGKMFAEYTDADVRTWTSAVFDEAIQNHYNMIFEGTMRTKQICNTIKEKLLPAGYQINIVVMAVPEVKSRISIYSRYQEQIEKYPIARFTSRSSHDAAYQGMLDTLQNIEEEHLYHTIKVCNRNCDVLFQTGDKGDIVSAINKEREKSLSQEEAISLVKQCDMLFTKMNARNEDATCLSDIQSLKQAVVSGAIKNVMQSVQQRRESSAKPDIRKDAENKIKDPLPCVRGYEK